MFKPDLLTTQIKHVDYPIWRAWLKKYRDRFGKLIFFFNENNRFPYLDHFMHTQLSELGDTLFLDQAQIDWGTQDWRNVSTNEMLKHTDSEWVASVEGDFFARDWDKLLDAVAEASKTSDMMGWMAESNDSYVHPAFWFIKRELLERTNKDFAAHNGQDHFGWITKDVMQLGAKITTTQELGFEDFKDTFHQGGVNQNYLEGFKPDHYIHRPELFYIYNYWSIKAPVVQSPVFMDMMVRMDTILKEKFPLLDPEVDERSIFYRM